MCFSDLSTPDEEGKRFESRLEESSQNRVSIHGIRLTGTQYSQNHVSNLA
jgi:hypothetical protein